MEANTAVRWNIPIVACCVEDGYEADFWLGVITAAPPGVDCSTDKKLNSSLDRLERELRAAKRILKSEYTIFQIFNTWFISNVTRRFCV